MGLSEGRAAPLQFNQTAIKNIKHLLSNAIIYYLLLI